MNMHKNARLTPLGRERLVGMIANSVSQSQAALACGVSAKTAAKWYRRFQSEGLAGLQDRSSRPRKLRVPMGVQGLTPFEYICKIWTNEPDRFNVDPTHNMLGTTRNYETWTEQGSESAEVPANRIWKQMLAEYEKPPMDAGVEDQLKDFAARRKQGTNPPDS